ncbi:WD-repeat protein [Cryptococcus wingfieldii CBS 7118]|uniref:WD-repeat protein n=1 Tax=Cryptococcus wingfieldii CBS 7118 TaxID=1295528 RepID=A0A1E3J9X9_9TREE|nr:WD-repeat protein [Cryptococcus wingfieldii CBS 7118]ODN97475.1 WD-repeat protein [Cryptococcus wingfieldii CBS 7118]
MSNDMGQPTHSGPPAEASTSANGHAAQTVTATSSLLSNVAPVRLPGSLMYEDDKDWVETREAYAGGEDADMEDDATSIKGKGKLSAGEDARPGVGGGKRMPVDREEAVRLMLQGLRDVGYHQSADVLEAESGYKLSTRAGSDFQQAILGGRWAEALALLPELDTAIPSDQTRYLIAQQKYLEYLELGQQKKALGVLRGELARVAKDQNVLHTLSGFMMCLDKEDLYERASWDGAAGISRRQLLEHLEAFISPSLIVPSRRLATLFDQARQFQQSNSPYIDGPTTNSLYTDYEDRQDQFPSVTTHILIDHSDEVWRIEWNPDGSKLASAGKDKVVHIWSVLPVAGLDGTERYAVAPLHHFRNHKDPIDAMAWAPDGKLLATGADKVVHLWDTETGEEIALQTPGLHHTDTISAIQWIPSGSEFLVASMDCRIIFYNRKGMLLRQWSTFPLQFNDFALTPDGSRIVAITTPLKRVANNEGLRSAAIWSQDLRCEMTSIRLTSDGKRALVSCSPDEVQEWNTHNGLRYLRGHSGHIQTNFLIRSCYGGKKDQFVLSGSEDGHVYVWQGSSSQPTEVLAGHTSVVNSVAWNPVASRKIFASCSDDKTVYARVLLQMRKLMRSRRIWQPPVDMDMELQAEDAGPVAEASASGTNGDKDGNGHAPRMDEDVGMVL